MRPWEISHPVVLLLLVFLMFVSGTGALAQTTARPPDVSLAVQLVPKDIANGWPAQLVMTVESSEEISGAQIQITVPPGFKADNASLALPTFTRRLVRTVVINREVGEALAGERPIVVELWLGTGSTRVVRASQALTFQYAPEISLARYLLVGMIGVALGYVLRLLIKVLGSVTPPLPAPQAAEEGEQPGPITRFVKRNYYLVDFLVTLGLGVLILVWLAHNGRPPQSAALWPSALTTGVGLGLLTNSELLTKLRP